MMPILYRHFADDGELLYVGASLAILQRHLVHTSAAAWYVDVACITLEHFPSKDALMEAEKRAILLEVPKYNRMFAGESIPPYKAPVPIVPYTEWSQREKNRYARLSGKDKSYIQKHITPSVESARIRRLNLNTLYFVKEGRVPE